MIDSFTSTWEKKSINVTHTLKISASTRNNRSPVKKKKKKKIDRPVMKNFSHTPGTETNHFSRLAS